jgi:hypothetical protein
VTEIAVREETTSAEALTSDIDSWAQIAGSVIKLANEIYDTPFVPDGLRGSAPAVAAAILTGRELGVGPMTALQHIHVIHNKPGLSALLMRALIVGQGHDWKDMEVTDSRVIVAGRRKGESQWTEASFTADQARRAKIDLGGYPQDKLYARATSRLARRKFADVIAGMPYSAEELEDGEAGDEAPAALPAAETKPRTARRRTAAPQTASPAASANPPSAGSANPPSGSPAGEAPMPPLPGEEEEPSSPAPSGQPAGHEPAAGPDERDYDTPGTVTSLQLKAIWTALNRNFGFGSDEKDQARAVCAHIVSHPLASSKDLTKNEAKAVLDTLASWQDVAEKHEESPRAFLIELMATASGEGDGA